MKQETRKRPAVRRSRRVHPWFAYRRIRRADARRVLAIARWGR